MLVLCVDIRVKPEQRDAFIKATRANHLGTRGEPGNLRFDVLANEEDANERSATVERLVKKADDAGLEPEELDELVHELTASVAADVNNGGLEDQIACLVDGIGAEHTEHQIDKLIEERQQEEQ